MGGSGHFRGRVISGVRSGKRFSRGIHQIVRQGYLNRHETVRLCRSKLRPPQHLVRGDLKQPK